MAKASKSLLNESGENGHPCLVPDLGRNDFGFSSLRMTFAVGLSYMTFIMGRFPLCPLFGEFLSKIKVKFCQNLLLHL